MKINHMVVISLYVTLMLLSAGCTTVRVYDKDGNVSGTCRITGFIRRGGLCIGHANGETALSWKGER